MGIIIYHYKDPYQTTSIMESNKFFFFRGSIVGINNPSPLSGPRLVLSGPRLVVDHPLDHFFI